MSGPRDGNVVNDPAAFGLEAVDCGDVAVVGLDRRGDGREGARAVVEFDAQTGPGTSSPTLCVNCCAAVARC